MMLKFMEVMYDRAPASALKSKDGAILKAFLGGKASAEGKELTSKMVQGTVLCVCIYIYMRVCVCVGAWVSLCTARTHLFVCAYVCLYCVRRNRLGAFIIRTRCITPTPNRRMRGASADLPCPAWGERAVETLLRGVQCAGL